MKTKKARFAVLLLLLGVAFWGFLESPWSHPPGWWRAHRHWPHASGPVRWRVVAPWHKLSGHMPEITWGRLAGYFFDVSGEAETSGFVRRLRHEPGEKCTTLWQTPLGEIWGREADEDLLEFLVTEQLIDRVYDGGGARVHEGDVVVDVGAHLGTFTKFALAHGARQVVAFEPEAVNVACLEKTFSDEIENERVILVDAAAWHSAGVLEFNEPQDSNSGAGRVSDQPVFSGTAVVQVPAVAIDDVVSELGLEKVDFVKMDIEGAERHALTGARHTLERFTPRMALCVYHNADDYEVLSKIAREAQPAYRIQSDGHHAFFFGK